MRNLSGAGYYISNRIGRSIADYKLIEDKDRILVGLSGGKDSLTLLKLLNERKKWAPVSYELVAMHVETDFHCASCVHTKLLKKFCDDLGVRYHCEKIKILDKDRKTSCFWCSWNRRKALFTAADAFKCNKVALGHHKDDIIETLLLNMFYHGEFSAMNPRQELFGGRITLIRPLCYVEEEYTKKFSKEEGFPSQMCKCPNSQISKRRMVKNLIKDLEKDCEFIRTNLFKSMTRINKDYIQVRSSSDPSFEEAKL